MARHTMSIAVAMMAAAALAGDYPYTPAAMTNVAVTGGFWLPRTWCDSSRARTDAWRTA